MAACLITGVQSRRPQLVINIKHSNMLTMVIFVVEKG